MPKLDALVGMGLYSTKTPGIGGSIKQRRDDFIVSEAISEKALSAIGSESGYAVYVLEKDGTDTNHALMEIEKKTGMRLKALGLKDSRAVTSQYVCALSKTGRTVRCEGNRFSLKHVGFSQRPLTAKDMVGNKFTIRISGAGADVADFEEQENIANYFGYQRFGSSRPVSHLIGKCIMRADYGGALRALLSETSEYDTKERTEIRRQLGDTAQFPRLLESMPRDMDLERAAVAEITKGGTEESAIRTMRPRMRKFFVQSFQSYIFNKTMTMAMEAGEDLTAPQERDVCFDEKGILGRARPRETGQAIAVPLVGHSYYRKTRFEHYISQILKEEETAAGDFFLRHMQEANIEGGFRMAHVQCSGYTAKDQVVEFTLSRGSYATVVMREIIKPENPMSAGFA